VVTFPGDSQTTLQFVHQAIAQNRLPAAYLVRSHRADWGYLLALRIAERLNCERPPVEGAPLTGCGACPSCRWTRQNRHPAVITLSRHTGFLDPKQDDALKQISVHQTEGLLAQLGKTSPFWRVIILCNSSVEPPHPDRAPYSEPLQELNPVDPDDDEPPVGLWQPLALRAAQLPPLVADRLLKTLEEPPEKTLFVILSEDEAQLAATIVSRTQRLLLPLPLLGPQDTEAALGEVSAQALVSQWQHAMAGGGDLRWHADLIALVDRLSTQPVDDPSEATRFVRSVQRALRQAFHQQPSPLSFRTYRQLQHRLEAMARDTTSLVNPALVWRQLASPLG
jgi:hypothetical protein